MEDLFITYCPIPVSPELMYQTWWSQTLLNALPTIIQYPKTTLDLHPLLVKYCAVILMSLEREICLAKMELCGL